MDSTASPYQNALIQKALPLSERVVEAFYACPRHLFIPEYSIKEAYADRALLIYESPPFVSTISQPTFVLRILNMLELKPGQRVYELGTGSGWNASMIGYLVGPEGQVVTTEIIPEVAERARHTLERMHIHNVKVLTADGFEGISSETSFDRIIFTAGTGEFPKKLFAGLKEDGLMIFVRKGDLYGGDTLELIRKHNGKPEVKISIPCTFVPVIRDKEFRFDNNGTL